MILSLVFKGLNLFMQMYLLLKLSLVFLYSSLTGKRSNELRKKKACAVLNQLPLQ